MDIIVIICLIAGAASIAMSFFIKEGTGLAVQEKEKIAEEIRQKALSDESLKKVINTVEKNFVSKLSEAADDRLNALNDKMSEASNNKMLAIDEMSRQLIEKIEQNHKEVIFLYDMLNEKSENLKDFSSKIEGMRKELENEEKRIKALGHDLDDKIVRVKEARQTVISKPAKPVQEEKNDAMPVPKQAEALVEMQKEEEAKKPQPPVLKEETSLNDRILKMKGEGKSVIEISKALGMGQGEVQLVLGLYGK